MRAKGSSFGDLRLSVGISSHRQCAPGAAASGWQLTVPSTVAAVLAVLGKVAYLGLPVASAVEPTASAPQLPYFIYITVSSD